MVDKNPKKAKVSAKDKIALKKVEEKRTARKAPSM